MARRKLVTGRVQLWVSRYIIDLSKHVFQHALVFFRFFQASKEKFESYIAFYFKGHPIAVDWAEPEEDVDDDIMQSVKVLYVRNLLIETNEDVLRAHFSTFGKVERVKKIRDYAFVHYEERESAVQAVDAGEQQLIDGEKLSQKFD